MINLGKNAGTTLLLLILIALVVAAFAAPASAATTAVTVTKYDAYGAVVGTPQTVDINWMENTSGLPVYGDGTTHYYFQGPTFDHTSIDTLWNPDENNNVDSRDYGAVKGTDVRDLCNLVGGMDENDYVTIKGEDNFAKDFDYDDVYTPDPEAMRMVLAWYNGEESITGEGQGVGYPPDFSSGMRLFFFADTTVNPWGRHCFGLWDMHENLEPSRWHYYFGGDFEPSSSGLSVKVVDRIEIHQPNLISCDAAGNPVDSFAPGETAYVKGLGLDASTDYKVWIQEEPVLLSPINELDIPYFVKYFFSTANDPSGSQETVTTDANGDFAPVAVWTIDPSATDGEYDIAADNQASGTVGTYDSSDEIDNPGWKGFEVAAVPPVAQFYGQADTTANGGFETGDLTGWTTSGAVTVVTVPTYSGSYAAELNSPTQNTPAECSQSIDLTDVDQLAYYYQIPTITQGTVKVYIDTTEEKSYSTQVSSWTHDTVDTSGYSGTHTISFVADSTKNNKALVAYLDDIETISQPSGSIAGSAPLTVYFTDTSTKFPTSWLWNFGDGGTSTEQNPTHTYTADGLYSVSLTATNAAGSDTETKTGFVMVGSVGAPVADFSADPTSGTAPLSVSFTDLSTGDGITDWAWNFGDGSSSELQHPSHTYTEDGTYTVSLTVTNPGGSDTETKTGYITVGGSGSMTVIPSNKDVLLLVSNYGGARFDDYGNDTYHFFNPLQSPSQGLNALHLTTDTAETGGQVTFTDAQSGVVYLSDTGGRGWDDDGILMIAVNGTVPNDFQVHIQASGYQWVPVDKDSLPTYDNVTYVSTALDETFTKDDFLYGPQIWKPCPAVNYPIFDNQSMADTGNTFSIMFIDLNAGILGTITLASPSFDGQPVIDNGMIRLEYSFTNLETFAAFDAYAYTVDSNQGQGVRWTNRLSETGASGYAVFGQSLTEAPIADFTANVTYGEAPLTVQFTDTSTGGTPTAWSWDFDNNGIIDSTEQNPQYTYTASGTYTVKLTVSNSAGSDTETKTGFIEVTGTGPAIEVDATGEISGWNLLPESDNEDSTSIDLTVSTTASFWDVRVSDVSANPNPGHMSQWIDGTEYVAGGPYLATEMMVRALDGDPYVGVGTGSIILDQGYGTGSFDIWLKQTTVSEDQELESGVYRVEITFTGAVH